LEQIPQDRAALVAVVADQHGGCARVQLLDGGETHQRCELPQGDDTEGGRRGGGEGDAEHAEAFAPRKQILDEMRDTEPEPEQHEAGYTAPEHRAPTE